MARDKAAVLPATGPAADYPIVLGAPFTIDGVTYTPADRLNFDQVGHAAIDAAAGQGVSIAHRTLPLPSYVEVTSLRTGRTILARVERRGPMTPGADIALSPGAAAQLGTGDGLTPVRVRRVNPPEAERALLRAGQAAPARMDTPMSLVGVLLRKLDPQAAVPAAAGTPPSGPSASAGPVPGARPASDAAATGPKQPAVVPPSLKPVPKPVPPAATAAPAPVPAPKTAATPASAPKAAAKPAESRSVVQVGAFSSRAAATAVAARVGGTVSPAGKLFRVRIGGFSSAAQAGAALAKARAAGYSDARIQHAD
ncbi:MAG: SPOR domain-containing protein [Sphingomonadales bacterium]|nr:SPOR domain-containing protein [Sphingomonadales bacterium]